MEGPLESYHAGIAVHHLRNALAIGGDTRSRLTYLEITWNILKYLEISLSEVMLEVAEASAHL